MDKVYQFKVRTVDGIKWELVKAHNIKEAIEYYNRESGTDFNFEKVEILSDTEII
jgi:hypothetical protein